MTESLQRDLDALDQETLPIIRLDPDYEPYGARYQRPKTSEKVHGTSFWMNRPRVGFTELMMSRAAEMSDSREGRKIRPMILGEKRERGICE